MLLVSETSFGCGLIIELSREGDDALTHITVHCGMHHRGACAALAGRRPGDSNGAGSSTTTLCHAHMLNIET